VNLKVMIDADLKRRFDDLISRKRTSLTSAIDAMARWLLDQDSLVQNVVLGQLEEYDKREILRLIARNHGLVDLTGAEETKGMTPEQAALAAHALIDRLRMVADERHRLLTIATGKAKPKG
jgi:nucleoside-diphosphate-sugar epimerase